MQCRKRVLDCADGPSLARHNDRRRMLKTIQDSLDELMHFFHCCCQIVSPSKTSFLIVSAHRLPNITLLTLMATLEFQGASPTYILNEDTQLVIRAIGASHT